MDSNINNKKNQPGVNKKKISSKSLETTDIQQISPTEIRISASEKREIIVDRNADQKNIKSAWLGPEITEIYSNMPLLTEQQKEDFYTEKLFKIRKTLKEFFTLNQT